MSDVKADRTRAIAHRVSVFIVFTSSSAAKLWIYLFILQKKVKKSGPQPKSEAAFMSLYSKVIVVNTLSNTSSISGESV